MEQRDYLLLIYQLENSADDTWVTNQRDDDVGTLEVKNPVEPETNTPVVSREEGEMDMDIETEEEKNKTKR